MRRSWPWRASLLLASLAMGAGVLSCGTGGPDDPFRLFRRILLDSLHRGTGTLQPGERPLLFGPFPAIGDDEAGAARLQLQCLNGPGLVQARLWYDTPANGLQTARDAFGFSQDQIDLNVGAQELDTTIGHFRADAFRRLFLEVALVSGQPVTEVQLTVTPRIAPLDTTFDLEPNNTADQAVQVEPNDDGTALNAFGSMNPLFGDDLDWYRVGAPNTGALELTTTVSEPTGAQTTIEVFDGPTTLLGGLTGTTVDATPLLGNIPLAGRLFRSRPQDNEKRSLVVVITPRIVIDE